jgi:hypothetical protein
MTEKKNDRSGVSNVHSSNISCHRKRLCDTIWGTLVARVSSAKLQPMSTFSDTFGYVSTCKLNRIIYLKRNQKKNLDLRCQISIYALEKFSAGADSHGLCII